MKKRAHISANVLPVVVVVSVVMLLGLIALISLWEADFLLFSKINYNRMQRANAVSALLLYTNYPDLMQGPVADTAFRLFDSIPSSEVRLARRPWGLFEVLSVTTSDGFNRTCLLGASEPFTRGVRAGFYYTGSGAGLTLAGNTNLQGVLHMPRQGFTFGQMQSVFFSGEKPSTDSIKTSDTEFPLGAEAVRERVAALLSSTTPGKQIEFTDSLQNSFKSPFPVTIDAGSGVLTNCIFHDYVMLTGDELYISSSCELRNVVVVARKVVVEDGVEGSAQIFARDSVLVGEGVALEYPSGIYSGLYAELAEGSTVDGFMMCGFDGEKNTRQANMKKAVTSTVRGLVYVRGVSQVQGIITGSAFLEESNYYAPYGFYRNIMYDASVLADSEVVYPVWFDEGAKRKLIAWVK